MTMTYVFHDNFPPPEDLEATPYIDLSSVIIRDEQNSSRPGSFADVWIGWLKKGINPPMKVGALLIKVAFKVLQVSTTSISKEGKDIETVRRQLNREVWTWSGLNHPNILKFLGLAWTFGRAGLPALISPYCSNGTITEYLGKNPGKDKIFLIKGVAKGLEYLHQNDVVHGDLKPNDIIIDDSGNPLVCDFGESINLIHGGFIAKRVAGAARYQAPELLSRETQPTKATDAYVFALTSFRIWSGEEPYSGLLDHSVVFGVLTEEMRPKLPIPPVHGEDVIWPILQECWTTCADNRLTMQQTVEKLKEY